MAELSKNTQISGNVSRDPVASIATLKARTPWKDDEVVYVSAHTTEGDGGGGTFKWDAANTTADDNGIYLQPDAGGTGRWVRQYSGDVNVRWFGASPSATAAANYTAFTAAIAIGKAVFVPPGTYTISTALTLDYNKSRIIYGLDWQSTKIQSAASDVILIGGVNDAGGGFIEGLHLLSQAGGGNCLVVNYDLTNFRITRCKIEQENLNKSLFYMLDHYAGHVLIDNCIFTMPVGTPTAYPIYIYSDEVVNGIKIQDCWWNNSGGTVQFMILGTSNASSYVTNCEIKNITCEQTNGGMIRFEGVRGSLIENVASYDMNTTQTGHGIFIGKNNLGLNSSRITIRQCWKHPIAGYSLGAGISDIELESGAAANCIIQACVNAQAGNAFTVNYNNNKCLHIDPPSEATEANYTNNSNVRYIDINGDWEGLVFPKYSLSINGTEWTEGAGQPEGVVSAPPGSLYSRTSPGNYQQLYAKLTGTGNTGWNVTLNLPLSNTTDLENIAATVNTSAEKVDGYVLFNTTTQLPVVAAGAADGDVWKTLSGSIAHTPV